MNSGHPSRAPSRARWDHRGSDCCCLKTMPRAAAPSLSASAFAAVRAALDNDDVDGVPEITAGSRAARESSRAFPG